MFIPHGRHAGGSAIPIAPKGRTHLFDKRITGKGRGLSALSVL